MPRSPDLRPGRQGPGLLAVGAAAAAVFACAGVSPAFAAIAPAQPVPQLTVAEPSGIEALPAYVAATSCDAVAKPGVVRFAALVEKTYPGTGSVGIVNTCAAEGGVSEHTEGRAWDWAVAVNSPTQVAQVKALTTWLLAPDALGEPAANARRLGLMYVIWDKQILGLYSLDAGWRPYACSGVTGCHQDHVHFSFSWAGARGVTSFWSGRVAAQDFGPCPGVGQMFALPRSSPNPVRCAGPTYRSPADPVVAALEVNADVVLGLGSTGLAVAAVQQALGGTVDDGQFGALTQDLVLTYQERHHLLATGTVTRAVRADLISYVTNGKAQLAPPTAAVAPVVSSTGAVPPTVAKADPVLPLASYVGQLLQVGSVGPAVTAVQQAIGATPDGAFGQLTAAALRAFQTAHQVPATGVTDEATWTALTAGVPPTLPVTPPTPVPVPVPVPKPLPAPAPQPAPTPAPKVAPKPIVQPAVLPLAHYKGQLLRLGSTGPAVTALQRVIGTGQDGSFGPLTRGALLTWQHTHHVPQTGVTDATTWSRLVPHVAAPTPRPASHLAAYRTTVLRQGSRGPAVTALQRALRIGADGQFGPLTRAAVLAYQRSRHLPITGVVTATTWTALISGR